MKISSYLLLTYVYSVISLYLHVFVHVFHGFVCYPSVLYTLKYIRYVIIPFPRKSFQAGEKLSPPFLELEFIVDRQGSVGQAVCGGQSHLVIDMVFSLWKT